MSFASPLFLWYFLPAVLAAVVVAPRHWRNGIVAIAGLAFYAVGADLTTLHAWRRRLGYREPRGSTPFGCTADRVRQAIRAPALPA